MRTDFELLRLYADRRDAEAFAELVRRHAGLVYGTCLRANGNSHAAEDASQECFLQLARHAGAISTSLPGWLHQTALTRARMERRGAARRRRREEEVAAMNTHSEPTWDEIAPHVDEALHDLPEEFRDPLILHFLEGKNQEQVAEELAISQPTVSRRIEKGVSLLRDRLKKSGIILSAVAVATLFGQNAATAAPATLSVSLGKMALCGISATGKGAATAATGASLLGGIAMKLGIASILAVAAITTVIVTHSAPAAPEPVQPPVDVSPSQLPAGTEDKPVAKDAPWVQFEIKVISMTQAFEKEKNVLALVGTNVPKSAVKQVIKDGYSSSEATVVFNPHVTALSGKTEQMDVKTKKSSYVADYVKQGEEWMPEKRNYFPSRKQMRCRATVDGDAIVLSNIGVLCSSTALMECSSKLKIPDAKDVKFTWFEPLQQKHFFVSEHEFRIEHDKAIFLPIAQTRERGSAKVRLALDNSRIKEKLTPEARTELANKGTASYLIIIPTLMLPEEKPKPLPTGAQVNITVQLYPRQPFSESEADVSSSRSPYLPIASLPDEAGMKETISGISAPRDKKAVNKFFPSGKPISHVSRKVTMSQEEKFEMLPVASSKYRGSVNVLVTSHGANEKNVTLKILVEKRNENGILVVQQAIMETPYNRRPIFPITIDNEKRQDHFWVLVTPGLVNVPPTETAPHFAQSQTGNSPSAACRLPEGS